MNRHVDIIIPVYNALDDLKKCVESVVLHTDLRHHRLILIDDKSPDEKVGLYLNAIKDSGIYTMKNDTNLGFSGTINRGLLLSNQNDVILLNSDTVVTPKWVEKLLECAYSDAGIATVTPLSNNGSICSVPFSNESNKIPENMTLDEYADEIERISMRKYTPIPMGIGFCMFIKRNVIEEVGLFDSETFGRGYGEENDFCNRAAELGYRHVLCDTTFIYHKGTASFEISDKEELGKEHESVLEERYPQLNRQLEWYWAYQQNGIVHKNVELFHTLKLGKDKKNIFYLIQADFQEGCSNNIGGTQLHVKDLVYGLKNEYNIFVAARDGEILRVAAYIDDKVIPFKFYIGPIPLFYVYREQKMAELYRNLLLAFKIDLVHIHHTMGLTLELYYAAEKLGIPAYVSLHDYYTICPTLRLLDTNKESCIGKYDWDNCKKCMKKSLGICEEVDFIRKWRSEHEKVLEICDKIIIPTQSAADILSQYYSVVNKNSHIIPHGIDNKMFSKTGSKAPYHHSKLHVAFVGGICETKGSDVIYKMITANKKELQWYIFGGIDGVELLHLEQENLTKTGWYRRDELKALLQEHEIDVVCILSTVAETYCYTLSEVVACGVPVIVTDIGALGERMRNMSCGWIVPERAGHEEILQLLLNMQEHPKMYEEKRKKAEETSISSIKDMVSEYQLLYSTLEKVPKQMEQADYQKILDGYLAAISVETPSLAYDEIMAQNRSLKNEIDMIYDSEIFKIMKKIANGLDVLKRCIKRTR